MSRIVALTVVVSLSGLVGAFAYGQVVGETRPAAPTQALAQQITAACAGNGGATNPAGRGLPNAEDKSGRDKCLETPTEMTCAGPPGTVEPPGGIVTATLRESGGSALARREIHWSAESVLISPEIAVTDETGTASTSLLVPSDAGLEFDAVINAVFEGDIFYGPSDCQVTVHVRSPGLPVPTPTPSAQ